MLEMNTHSCSLIPLEIRDVKSLDTGISIPVMSINKKFLPIFRILLSINHIRLYITSELFMERLGLHIDPIVFVCRFCHAYLIGYFSYSFIVDHNWARLGENTVSIFSLEFFKRVIKVFFSTTGYHMLSRFFSCTKY
jgi:hypothetical protein